VAATTDHNDDDDDNTSDKDWVLREVHRLEGTSAGSAVHMDYQ
jgi:hypothetical protein